MQTVPSSPVQSAFEEQSFAQLMLIVLEQTVSPVVRFRQNQTSGGIAGQLAQPRACSSASPVPHPPQSIVPPHPSWTVPH